LTETVRLVAVWVAFPLAGLTDSQFPLVPVVDIVVVKERVPVDAVTPIVWDAGAGAPDCELNINDVGVTLRF
jgi:hypothetical protein